MSLIFDETANLAGRAGLHALIAGVSRYRHLPGGEGPPAVDGFGLQQLSSTALSASRVRRWLFDRRAHLPAPLATCRFLASPSEGERGIDAELAGATPCTRRNFAAMCREWRTQVAAHPDNVSFFYFAGHGLQRSRSDAVMLFDDFADPGEGPRREPSVSRPLVQIWQRGRAPANMMVPTSAGYPCRLSIAEGSDGAHAARATLANPSADLLVRYAYRADVKRSTVVTLALDAEALLAAKLVDPVAALVGAYALLKLGDLDRLHEWTENLRRGFDWLPDGLIVRGEHLARTGRHAEACDAFTELPRRGLPISSEGLSWSGDRLRSYARATSRALSPERRAQAQTVLALLQPLAMAADFRCPFTAYPGADPHRPSATVAPGDPPSDARAIG